MTACKVTALAALHASGRRVAWKRAAAALAADAASHYWADRRTTLAALADCMDRHGWPGKARYAAEGGAAHMDQAFHTGCLYAAALIAAPSR